MDTPSQRLAVKIIERLIAEEILSPDDRKKLLDKLGDGQLNPQDWRLAIEMAQGKRGGE